MNESFYKALKWYFVVIFMVVGATCFMIADETGDFKLTFVGVMAFGVVYVLSSFWQDMDTKIFLISAVLFLGLAQVSGILPRYLYFYTGIDLRDYSSYFIWAVLEGVVGIPIMTLVFKRYD